MFLRNVIPSKKYSLIFLLRVLSSVLSQTNPSPGLRPSLLSFIVVAITMGNAHSLVINKTHKKICVITFNLSDMLYSCEFSFSHALLSSTLSFFARSSHPNICSIRSSCGCFWYR